MTPKENAALISGFKRDAARVQILTHLTGGKALSSICISRNKKRPVREINYYLKKRRSESGGSAGLWEMLISGN